jgi:predicted dehydrogenase
MMHPLLLDAAVQHFDMVRAVTGLEPEKVFCREWKRTGSSLSGFGSASAIFELTGGVPLIYNATWDQRGDYPATTGWWGTWRIQGSEGELRAEGKKGIWINGVSSPTTVQPLDVRALSLVVFDQFLRTIRTGSEAPTSAWSDLKTLAMSEMAIRSAESGASVTLSDLNPSPYAPPPEDVETGAGPVEIG